LWANEKSKDLPAQHGISFHYAPKGLCATSAAGKSPPGENVANSAGSAYMILEMRLR
jgi:hypothetical protein